jgi:exodeoxyribonuclease VII large subunit
MKLTKINFESHNNAKIPTVSELTARIRSVLENDFAYVSVTGELSNVTLHSSGHRYFSLKDEGAQISCVMWRGKQLSIKLKDGLKVNLTGKLTVYPPQGRYQIDVNSMLPVGEGDLYLAFMALKAQLESEGYFDVQRKRPLPYSIMKIGVSTSPTGAAIQDIFSTISRRFPLATVYFRPTLVQGEGAASDIADAISDLNKMPVDVIIIGRGGGSIEDLWAYNERIVADAIFNSEKPIISAVGHETDFTIADFVADLRAATPTASAELVTPNTIEDYFYHLDLSTNKMEKSITKVINDTKSLISKDFALKGIRRITEKLYNYDELLKQKIQLIQSTINSKIQLLNSVLIAKSSLIRANDPIAPLNKGYALLQYDGNYIDNDTSLHQYKEVEILRKNEKVNVSINPK